MTSEFPDLRWAAAAVGSPAAGFRVALLPGFRLATATDLPGAFLVDLRPAVFLTDFRTVFFLADLDVVLLVALRVVDFFLVELLRAVFFADFRAVCFFCFAIRPTGCFFRNML